MIDQKVIDSALSYEEYLKQMKEMSENKQTSGAEQTKELIEYTKLNFSRMRRLNKTIEVNSELQKALNDCKEPMVWLVITESWCGDAAQNIPLFNKLAESKDCISLRLIYRDENLEIMDQFLTNGGRSIPKLIALRKSDLKVLGSWGPRAEKGQEMVAELKKDESLSHEDLVKEIQLWYTKDKTQSQQKEMTAAIKRWQKESSK